MMVAQEDRSEGHSKHKESKDYECPQQILLKMGILRYHDKGKF